MMSEICGITPEAWVFQAEDLAVLAERDDTLLDARAAGVEDADDRHPTAQGELHDLDDLLARDLAEGAAEGREVLRVHRDGAPVDRADAGDHGVAVGAGAVHPERRGAVADVLVEFDEAARVDELLDPLACGALAFRVLLGLRGLLGVENGLLEARAEVGDLAGGGREIGLFGHRPTLSAGADPSWRVRTSGRAAGCR